MTREDIKLGDGGSSKSSKAAWPMQASPTIMTSTLAYVAAPQLLTVSCLLVGNVFVLLVIRRSRLLKSRQNFSIVHLVLCDLFRGLVVLAMNVALLADREVHREGLVTRYPTACNVWGFFTMFSNTMGTLAILILLYDRLMFITSPLNYIYRVNMKLIIFTVAYNILHAFLMAVLPIFGWGRYGYILELGSCDVIWEDTGGYPVFIAVWVYFIPMSLSSACYIKIFLVVRKRLCQIRVYNAFQARPTPQTTGLTVVAEPDMIFTTTVKILFIILIMFIMSWFPQFVYSLAVYSTRGTAPISSLVYALVRTVSLVTSTVNPWLYGIYNRKFRRTFKSLITCNKASSTEVIDLSQQPSRSISMLALNDYPMDYKRGDARPVTTNRDKSIAMDQVYVHFQAQTSSQGQSRH